MLQTERDRSEGFLLLLIWMLVQPAGFWLGPLIQCKWGFHHTACYCTATLYLLRLGHPDNAPLLFFSFAIFSCHSVICVLLCQSFLFFHLFIICLTSTSVFVRQTLIFSPRLSSLSSCHHRNGWRLLLNKDFEAFLKHITQVQILDFFVVDPLCQSTFDYILALIGPVGIKPLIMTV